MSHLLSDAEWDEYQGFLKEKYPERFIVAPEPPSPPSMVVPEEPLATAPTEEPGTEPMGGA